MFLQVRCSSNTYSKFGGIYLSFYGFQYSHFLVKCEQPQILFIFLNNSLMPTQMCSHFQRIRKSYEAETLAWRPDRFHVERIHRWITHLTPRLESAPLWPKEHILKVELDVILNTRHFGNRMERKQKCEEQKAMLECDSVKEREHRCQLGCFVPVFCFCLSSLHNTYWVGTPLPITFFFLIFKKKSYCVYISELYIEVFWLFDFYSKILCTSKKKQKKLLWSDSNIFTTWHQGRVQRAKFKE